MLRLRPFIVLLCVFSLLACSRKKDTFTSRTYHRMTAKFNPLFNGEVAFDEGLASLTAGHTDRFGTILDMYPWGNEEQAQSIVPKMDRAIEKAGKVIREHSMMIDGQQKNPYAIDAYMLLAKAYFFKRDYFKSLEGFNHIIQKFPRSEQALEAQIWALRCNTRIGSEYAARACFDKLYKNKKLSDRLVPHALASMAELEISLGNMEAAASLLREALENDPRKKDRIRWNYVLGQVYQQMGLRNEASKAFEEVVADHPSDYTLYINAQLQRALNFDVLMGKVEEVYEDLEDMAEDAKNTEFRDQIYYVMGLLALEDDDYPKAEESLKKSIRYNLDNMEQRGLSYLKLAEINFNFREYVPAQAYYDSTYSSLPNTHPRYKEVERLRSSLNDLVAQIVRIETNDSLIRLAGMSEAEQAAIFENYIAEMKRKEEKEAERAANLELTRALAEESAASTGPVAGTGGGSWYFYNTRSRAAGISSFRAYWGSRELKDNWRRSLAVNETPFGNLPAGGTTAETDENKGGDAGPSGSERYNIQAYIAQIPKTPEAVDKLHKENQAAFLKMAFIYKNDIRDVPEAIKTYNKLRERYPDCDVIPEALYALYLSYKVDGDSTAAEAVAIELTNRFPHSEFARLINGTAQNTGGHNEQANVDYREAYEAFKRNDHHSTMSLAKSGLDKHKNTSLAAKFDLLLGLSKVGVEGTVAYAEHLRHVIETYPDSPEATFASILLNRVDPGSGAEVKTAANGNPALYTFQADGPHKAVLILPNQGVDMNQLRNEVTDYNREFHRFENLQMKNYFLDPERQLISISGLEDFASAKAYVEQIQKNTTISSLLPTNNMRIFAVSDANYLILFREKDVEGYVTFYKQNTEQ